MEIHVVPVQWATHGEKLRQVRGVVFIEEQKVPRDLEWDGLDDQAHHFLAMNEAGQAIGCARLLPSGQIGRMAVLKAFRGTGIGERLLDAAVEQAKKLRMDKVHLHAQIQAEPFYRKCGFQPVGQVFMEAGIPHRQMELDLPIPFENQGALPRPAVRESRVETAVDDASELLSYRGASACAEGLVNALSAPRRQLMIYSQQLDPALFDRPEVSHALSAFARSGPPVRVQVLIHDSSLMVARGHRLLELARRLDSKIEIRRVPETFAESDATYLTWDSRGYWLQPDHRTYVALADHYDPVQANRFCEGFVRLWERSAGDPELRNLRL